MGQSTAGRWFVSPTCRRCHCNRRSNRLASQSRVEQWTLRQFFGYAGPAWRHQATKTLGGAAFAKRAYQHSGRIQHPATQHRAAEKSDPHGRSPLEYLSGLRRIAVRDLSSDVPEASSVNTNDTRTAIFDISTWKCFAAPDRREIDPRRDS